MGTGNNNKLSYACSISLLDEQNIRILKYEITGAEAVAIVVPKICGKIKTDLLDKSGIYFLYSTDTGITQIYVGKAEDSKVGERIFGKHTNEVDNFWTNAVCIVPKGDLTWGVGQIHDYEGYFIDEIMRLADEYPGSIECLNSKKEQYGNTDANIDFIKQYISKTISSDLYKEEGKDNKPSILLNESFATKELHANEEIRSKDNVAKVVFEYITPPKIANALLDNLPEELWNPDTRFLDICCKDGIFLQLIFERLFNSEAVKKKFDNPAKRSNHILSNQIFGIAISDVSEAKSLEITSNIVKIEVGTIINDKVTRLESIKDKLKEINKEGDNMKFDVIIGNPPYQKGTNPIYQEFINLAMDLDAEHICMITKNNYINCVPCDKNGLSSTRTRMIQYGFEKLIQTGNIFDEVRVETAIFKLTKGYEGKTHFIENKQEVEINSRAHNSLLKDEDGYIISKVHAQMDKTREGKLLG